MRQRLLAANRSGGDPSVFNVSETGNILTVTPRGLAKVDENIRIFFPERSWDYRENYAFGELFRLDDSTPKEGMHHPEGLLAFWGNGVKQGFEIQNTTNIDIAPTILALLGIEVPPVMTGRVLSEAFNLDFRCQVSANFTL